MGDLSVSDLLTVVGNAGLTLALVEVVKRTLAMSDAAVDRFGPIVALAIAVVLAVAAAVVLHADLAQAVLTGVVSGTTSIGIYKVAQRIVPGD
jgi:hypothetical protein